MKKWLWILSITSLTLVGYFAFAQEVEVIETNQFLQFLIQSLGGLKGATTLAIVGFAIQAIVMLLKTPLFKGVWEKLGSQWKLLIITGLTLISGVVALMISGVSIGAALVHSTTLSALSVFLHQIFKQFIEKKPA